MDSKFNHITECIATWGIAMDAVKDNASIMCGYPSKEETEECARTMRVLGDAEEVMMDLSHLPNLPMQLTRFVKANDDRGCSHCWLSSRRSKDHVDCQQKIEEYFKAREALKVYALSLTQGLNPPQRPEPKG